LNTTLELSELNHQIGQLFMTGIPGTNLDEGTELLIRDFNLGGIILSDILSSFLALGGP